METRQINVMGKMVEIAEGATFADVAKDLRHGGWSYYAGKTEK